MSLKGITGNDDDDDDNTNNAYINPGSCKI
jgi:hypothetical protein